MKQKALCGLLAIAVVVAVAVWARAQEVIDSHAWLQARGLLGSAGSDNADGAATRQAVRDRITALRRARGKVQAFTRNGQWKSDRRRDTQSWFVQAQHNTDDGTLTGRLGVVGSRSLSGGTISGRIDGTSVSGTITDDAGAQLATFTGSINGQRMNGTYQTTDGDFGDWSYDGIESSGHRAIEGIEEPQIDAAMMQQPLASDVVAELGAKAAQLGMISDAWETEQ